MNFRLFLIVVLFLFANSLFSQESEVVRKEIMQDFGKFKSKAALNLVPFQDKKTGKYGYIGALSKKVVVPAKYDYLRLFNPEAYGEYKEEYFTLETKNGGIAFAEDRKIQISVSDFGDGSGRGKEELESGFTVLQGDELRIEKYSHIYSNVHSPFLYKNKLYAVAEKEDEDGRRSAIIDEEGNVAFGIDFSQYKNIALNEFAKIDDEPYFFAVNADDQLLFINPIGRKIIVSEGDGSAIYGKMVVEWVRRIRPTFGYGHYKDRILDFVKMEWLPQKTDGAEIEHIYYTSDKVIDCYTVSYMDYPNVNLYIRVKDDKYPYPYYIGWDGYRYIP